MIVALTPTTYHLPPSTYCRNPPVCAAMCAEHARNIPVVNARMARWKKALSSFMGGAGGGTTVRPGGAMRRPSICDDAQERVRVS